MIGSCIVEVFRFKLRVCLSFQVGIAEFDNEWLAVIAEGDAVKDEWPFLIKTETDTDITSCSFPVILIVEREVGQKVCLTSQRVEHSALIVQFVMMYRGANVQAPPLIRHLHVKVSTHDTSSPHQTDGQVVRPVVPTTFVGVAGVGDGGQGFYLRREQERDFRRIIASL